MVARVLVGKEAGEVIKWEIQGVFGVIAVPYLYSCSGYTNLHR